MQSNTENFKFLSDSSSSVGFFPDSSSLSDSNSSSYYSSSSSNSSYGVTFFLQQLPPVTSNCWMENIFAELATFTRNLLHTSGSFGPHSSPAKRNSTLNNKSKMPLIVEKLNEALYFAFPGNKELAQWNQLVEIDASGSKNYNNFMNKARKLREKIQLSTTGNRELFLLNNNITKNLAIFISNDTTVLSTAALIMLILLADRYPNAPQDKIFSLLHQDNLAKYNYNIYAAFKNLDLELSKNFLTKEAIQVHEQPWESYFTDNFGL